MERTKIVIFGGCGKGKDVLYSLDEKEYEIVAFLDNAKVKQDISLWGSYPPVKCPKEIVELKYDFVIVALPEYFSEMRQQLINLGVDSKKIVNWNTYVPIKRLDSRIGFLRSCCERILELNLEGACGELGVYQGDFAKYINRFLPDRKLYLFDTFEGFRDSQLNDKEQNMEKIKDLFVDTSPQEVIAKMDHPQNCIIRKGLFPKTAEGLEEQFVFVSIDADLYQPIYDGLSYFYPRLANRGGVIFVHDYGLTAWPGVKQAVDRFAMEQGVAVLPLTDKCLSCVIVKN